MFKPIWSGFSRIRVGLRGGSFLPASHTFRKEYPKNSGLGGPGSNRDLFCIVSTKAI